MGTPLPKATDPLCDNPRGYKWKKHLCRCAGCRDKATSENMRWSYRRYTGAVPDRVPVGEARAVLDKLRRRKMTFRYIAQETGLNSRTLGDIWQREHKTCQRRYLNALNAFAEATSKHTGKKASAERRRLDYSNVSRSQRAIQGLMLQGYSQLRIAEATGIKQQMISFISLGKQEAVLKTTEQKIVDYANRVGLTPGPDKRATAWAERRGYKALAEWDDLL